MRSLFLLTAAASLAACNSSGQRKADAPVAESNVQARPESAAEAPAPSSTETRTIPAAFLGVYDRDEAACAAPGEDRMEVRADEIRFHESIGKVRKVTNLATDRISVEADYQGEGESWSNVRELRLSDAGATVTVSGEGTQIRRRRCAATSPF